MRTTQYVGHDLIAQRKAECYDSGGPTDLGFSSGSVLCLMDPREFSQQSACFTRQIRRLNPGLPRSRAVDTAIKRSRNKAGIETCLIQYTIAVWGIRTGETSCSCSDMARNVQMIIQRLDLARTLTIECIEKPEHYALVFEHYAYLDRYYVRMCPANLRRGLANRCGELQRVWQSPTLSLWQAMPCKLPKNGRYINLEEPRLIRSRYSSTPRSRPRSRSPDFK